MIEEITKFLPRTLLSVKDPDHPFTFIGPDYLLSSYKGLLAIFIISENDRLNISKLLMRLINSRIAYPPYTKMILLRSNEIINDKYIDKEKEYFDFVVDLKQLKKPSTIIKEQVNQGFIKEIQHMQKRIFNLQSQIQTNNLRYLKRIEFKKAKIIPFQDNLQRVKYYNNLNKREESVHANIFLIENDIVGFKNLSKSQSDLKELSPFYEYVMKSEIQLFKGIPSFNSITRKYLSLNEIPTGRFDPLKAIRIASLFGWLIGNLTNYDELLGRKPIIK